MSYTVYARITDIFILTISTPAQQQVRKKNEIWYEKGNKYSQV